jgi:hypothetical protein
VISVTVADYDGIHSQDDRFIVTPSLTASRSKPTGGNPRGLVARASGAQIRPACRSNPPHGPAFANVTRAWSGTAWLGWQSFGDGCSGSWHSGSP